jgi:membrane-associated protein
MGLLQGLHGSAAVVLLCALLFAEEAGVPLPFAPGDILLVIGGLLVATGTVKPWVFGPLAFLAILGGSLVGYSWAGRLGQRGLRSLAERLRATKTLDHVSKRLRNAGPVGIGLSRLVPGLRIYTTLVAGAIGIGRREFLLGVVPAAAVWVAAFTLLGALVGVPAEHVMRSANRLAVRGAALVLVGAAAYLAARHVPGPTSDVALEPRPWRVPIAFAIDLGIVGCIATGLGAIARLVIHTEDPNGFYDSLALFAVIALGYILVSRWATRTTAAEAMLGVSYRRRPTASPVAS